MNSLLEEMESDTTKTPSIGDNSLKEMSDLCAEQAAIEEEMIREFEGRAEDPMSPNQVAAQQAENQARRYIAGAEKQLEGLAKMLDRLEVLSNFSDRKSDIFPHQNHINFLSYIAIIERPKDSL